MKTLDKIDARSRKLSIFDWKLAQVSAMCIALIVAKTFPQVLDLSVWWFAALALVCYIKPLYAFYISE